MNHKRSFRTLLMLLLIGLFIVGLTSCRLPASEGPESEGTPSEGFPVPGETNVSPTQIDLSKFATPTTQVNTPVVNPPSQATQSPATAYPAPEVTSAPASPEPTAAPVIYVQPTQGEPPETYVLQQGEYPFCIARRFDVNQAELLELNDLGTNTLVSPGTELKIPQTGTPFDGDRSLHDHPTTYEIQQGDNLNSIACYFGDVSPDMIALQNSLSTTDLPVGEVLVIP